MKRIKKRRFLKYFLLCFTFLFVVVSGFAAHEWFAMKPFYINNLFNRAFVQMMFQNPEGLTSMGVLEQFGIKGHNRKWGDSSLKGEQEQVDFLKKIYASMNLYQDSELNSEEVISKRIVQQLLGNPEMMEKYRYHNYPVNQLWGVQNELPKFMESSQRVEGIEDAENYIERLRTLPHKFNQIMEGIKKRESLNIIPPTFVIDKSIENMENFIGKSTEENILYISLRDKMKKAQKFSDTQQQEFLKQAKNYLEDGLFPVYRDYISYFDKLKSKSNNDAGVWKFPDGKNFYNYMLKQNTTTDMTADEIHALGFEEVARIEAEILQILESQGFDVSKGFTDSMNKLSADERFYYDDDDAGRAQILKDYEKIISEVKQGLGKAFEFAPAADVVVKRVPEFSEKTSAGAYYKGPTMDGEVPGTFYASLYDIKATPKYGMRTLAYHEAIPGHHFQIATQKELQGVPEFRKQIGFTSYSEGWALYAERLAWELGFQNDPFDNIGRLQAELFRAVRLVVDTGIHVKRWTREEAIQYMLDHTGMAESDVVSEIERYIVAPGQATSYKVGMIAILQMRQKAKDELGELFHLSDFHNVILNSGPMPLNLLRQQVDKYIEEKKSAS